MAAGKAVTLRPLTDQAAKPGATLERFAKSLRDWDDVLRIQFQLVQDDERTLFGVTAGQGSAKVERGHLPKAQIEVITRRETWTAIAAGSLSPLEAVALGRLRFRGDPQLARHVLIHLAADPEATVRFL
jgi:putative sterol carrier protein